MGPKSQKIILIIFLGPILIASVLPFLLSTIINQPTDLLLITFLIGLILFIFAKLSVIRGGNIFSFGFKQMSPKFKKMYLWGSVLMTLSAILAILLK